MSKPEYFFEKLVAVLVQATLHNRFYGVFRSGRQVPVADRIGFPTIHVDKAKSEDVFVNRLLFTQFTDKVTILKKSSHLPCSREKFQKNPRQVQSLRDKVAQANYYATTEEEANQVCETVRLMDQWINWLAAWARPSV